MEVKELRPRRHQTAETLSYADYIRFSDYELHDMMSLLVAPVQPMMSQHLYQSMFPVTLSILSQ